MCLLPAAHGCDVASRSANFLDVLRLQDMRPAVFALRAFNIEIVNIADQVPTSFDLFLYDSIHLPSRMVQQCSNRQCKASMRTLNTLSEMNHATIAIDAEAGGARADPISWHCIASAGSRDNAVCS